MQQTFYEYVKKLLIDQFYLLKITCCLGIIVSITFKEFSGIFGYGLALIILLCLVKGD